MNVFLLDIWHDLREKRLLPVAIALLVAALAVPLLLKKSASEESVPAKPPAPPANLPLANASVEAATGSDPDLNVFQSKDPFRPRKDRPQPPSPPSGSSGSPGSSPGGDGSGSSGSSGGSGGSGGAFGGVSPAEDGAAAASERSGGGGSGGGAPARAPSSTPAPPNRYRLFEYTVDLRYGRPGGSITTRRGVKELTRLPNDRNPLFAFLGVKTEDETAVFLVLGDELTFLELRAGQRKQFRDTDGRVYDLHLLKVNFVPTDKVVAASTGARVASDRPFARSDGEPLDGSDARPGGEVLELAPVTGQLAR